MSFRTSVTPSAPWDFNSHRVAAVLDHRLQGSRRSSGSVCSELARMLWRAVCRASPSLSDRDLGLPFRSLAQYRVFDSIRGPCRLNGPSDVQSHCRRLRTRPKSEAHVLSSDDRAVGGRHRQPGLVLPPSSPARESTDQLRRRRKAGKSTRSRATRGVFPAAYRWLVKLRVTRADKQRSCGSDFRIQTTPRWSHT